MNEIPLTGAPKESIDIKLVKRRIEIRTAFRNLDGSWEISLYDRATSPPTPLVVGVSVMMGVDILKPYGLGLGALFAVATSDDRRDAGIGELGVRVKLVHVPPDEVAALAAE